jgi:hypothetical protein
MASGERNALVLRVAEGGGEERRGRRWVEPHHKTRLGPWLEPSGATPKSRARQERGEERGERREERGESKETRASG